MELELSEPAKRSEQISQPEEKKIIMSLTLIDLNGQAVEVERAVLIGLARCAMKKFMSLSEYSSDRTHIYTFRNDQDRITVNKTLASHITAGYDSETYLKGILGTGYKMVMYDAWHDLPDRSRIIETEFCFGKTGHAAIIVETETARSCSPHVKSYGEDWIFLEEMMQYPHAKLNAYPTYHVNGDPTHPSLTYGRPRAKRRKTSRGTT